MGGAIGMPTQRLPHPTPPHPNLAGAPLADTNLFCNPSATTCYIFSRSSRLPATTGAWSTARGYCQGVGGDLVTFSSLEEQVRRGCLERLQIPRGPAPALCALPARAGPLKRAFLACCRPAAASAQPLAALRSPAGPSTRATAARPRSAALQAHIEGYFRTTGAIDTGSYFYYWIGYRSTLTNPVTFNNVATGANIGQRNSTHNPYVHFSYWRNGCTPSTSTQCCVYVDSRGRYDYWWVTARCGCLGSEPAAPGKPEAAWPGCRGPQAVRRQGNQSTVRAQDRQLDNLRQ
jgi:hypothetical protein